MLDDKSVCVDVISAELRSVEICMVEEPDSDEMEIDGISDDSDALSIANVALELVPKEFSIVEELNSESVALDDESVERADESTAVILSLLRDNIIEVGTDEVNSVVLGSAESVMSEDS